MKFVVILVVLAVCGTYARPQPDGILGGVGKTLNKVGDLVNNLLGGGGDSSEGKFDKIYHNYNLICLKQKPVRKRAQTSSQVNLILLAS